MKIFKPTLARCTNRTQKARTHPEIGEPEHWFNHELLEECQLNVCTFDFFIDWRNDTVSDVVWIKALANEPLSSDQPTLDDIKEYHQKSGQSYEAIAEFMAYQKLVAYYTILNAETVENDVAALVVDTKDNAFKIHRYRLERMMDSIKRLSGGPIRIGHKGLYYGTSPLECQLSTTDALWPGDVDTIVFERNHHVKAIYEYKKHNLNTDIKDQDFTNYYPTPDARKYKRLALLGERLKGDFSIYIIYYPTSTNFTHIKIERIAGEPDNLAKQEEYLTEIMPDPIEMGRAILKLTI